MVRGSASISIVLPVYNGESFIRKSISVLARFICSVNYPCEVIVVDDGSSDSTPWILKELRNHFHSFLRVFGYRVNRGKGFAFRYGALRAW